MDRPHIKYQPTSTDIDGPSDNESDGENSDCNETTGMMDGDNDVEDLGYADEEEDQGITNNGQVDPEEPPAADGHVEESPADEEFEDAHEGNIEEPGADSGGTDGEVGDEQPPRIEERDGEVGARGGEAPSTDPNISIVIPDGGDDNEESLPPPYGSPPTYEEVMKINRVRPSMSYHEAVSGDDLEWDRDEHVEPTMLQNRESLDPDNDDGMELDRVVLDSGPSVVERRTADTSFSAPGIGEQPRDEIDSPTSSSLPPVIFGGFSRRKWTIYIISFLVAIGALLMVILLPLTFSYIEYFQYGMKKGRISEVVEFTKKIYDAGGYPIGPGKTFKRYPAWAHLVNFDNIDFFTTDLIIMDADISFQYFIKQDELGLIEQKYDKSYEDTIKSVAQAAIKNKAATYSTKEYLSERGKIEQGLHDALRLKLGGNCCPSRDECIRLGSCHLCSSNQNTCNKGFHVDVRFFQMRQLRIPDFIEERLLNVQVILEGNEAAVYEQAFRLIRKDTEAEKEKILNNAAEITNNGTAKAQLIRKQGNTTANAKRESAHSQGLKLLYDVMNVDEDRHKASLHWLRTLERHCRLVSGISFKDYVALIQGLEDDD